MAGRAPGRGVCSSVAGAVGGTVAAAAGRSARLVKDHPGIALASVGAIACPVVVPVLVHGIGFGSGGIAAGSWAASFMSSYGGAVASNSACALLQSVGAAGLAAKGTVTAAAVGAASTAGLVKIFNRK